MTTPAPADAVRRQVILDVDTGNDDAVAIAMAAMHPGLELLGCTTVAGNLTVEQATDNTLRVLAALGRSDVPVRAGLSRPFAPRPYPPAPDRTKGLFHQVTLPGRRRVRSPPSTRHWNTNPRPFTWTATADEILAKVRIVQTNIKKLVNNNGK